VKKEEAYVYPLKEWKGLRQTHPWVVPLTKSHPKILRPTHPTSAQNKTHLRKLFISNLIYKDYPSHVEFESSIGFTKKIIFNH
jgi:hypothetical protein